MDFESVHNRHEKAVFEEIAEVASRYPFFARNPGLLADAACIALNALKPHYVRHDVDASFYMSDAQRATHAGLVNAAVESACKFVQSSEAGRRGSDLS
jgi:hypothetical protein